MLCLSTSWSGSIRSCCSCSCFSSPSVDVACELVSKSVARVINALGSRPITMSGEKRGDIVIRPIASYQRFRVGYLGSHEVISPLRHQRSTTLSPFLRQSALPQNPSTISALNPLQWDWLHTSHPSDRLLPTLAIFPLAIGANGYTPVRSVHFIIETLKIMATASSISKGMVNTDGGLDSERGKKMCLVHPSTQMPSSSTVHGSRSDSVPLYVVADAHHRGQV